jgi:hypothetical protein
VTDTSYQAVMGRRNQIMKQAVGLDYSEFESGFLAFDYEKMMAAPGLSMGDVLDIVSRYAIGGTPLIELKNITALSRKYAAPSQG